MFLIRRPSPAAIDSFLLRAKDHAFSYSKPGLTRGTNPAGYQVDHNRVRLGDGEQAYRRGVSAIRDWEMFNLGWVQLFPRKAPIAVGTTVAAVIRHFGFWSINASRIVYTIEEERRFGFAYGTLHQQHAEDGEERFSVEWNSEDDSVTYDLLAISKPQQWQTRMAGPVARALQRRFARDSLAAMVRAAASPSR